MRLSVHQSANPQQTLLLDADLLGLGRRSLGNRNGKNAIVQLRLDIVLVDARREAERAMELANRALRNPVGSFLPFLLTLVLLNLLAAIVARRGTLLLLVILNSSLVRLVVGGDLAGDEALGRSAGFVGALDTAFDD